MPPGPLSTTPGSKHALGHLLLIPLNATQVQATFAGGLAEHLQAAGGANASVAASLQQTLGQAQSMAQLLARDVAEGQRQLIRLASESEAAGAHSFRLPMQLTAMMSVSPICRCMPHAVKAPASHMAAVA